MVGMVEEQKIPLLIQLSVKAVELEVVVSSSISKIALNPNPIPGLNDDLSSSTVSMVLILLYFTFKFSYTNKIEK